MKIFLENKKFCNIKYAAERSGLSAHVIRMWERRYTAVKPERTQSNRRLFSKADVLRLQLLKKAVDLGHSISHVANLSSDDLLRVVNAENETNDIQNRTAASAQSIHSYKKSALQYIFDLNPDGLKATLEQASVYSTKLQLIENIIVPLCKEIGELWRQGKLKIIHEHMATPIIRTVLWSLLDTPEAADDAPRIVIATPINQRHDLGALAIAVIAREAGWHTAYFGSSLPAAEIAAAAISLNACAVALSITFSFSQLQLVKELKELRKLLSKDTVICIGGRGAPHVMAHLPSDTVQLITDLQSLNMTLDHLLVCRKDQAIAN